MAPAPFEESSTPQFEVAVHNGATFHACVLVVAGELDLASADRLHAKLVEQRRLGRRFVRVDLSDVTFIDATALGVLVDAHHLFLKARGTLVLTGTGPRIQRLLRITGLDAVLFNAGPRADVVPAVSHLPNRRPAFRPVTRPARRPSPFSANAARRQSV
jgi:anti-sigma B factor antagonist